MQGRSVLCQVLNIVQEKERIHLQIIAILSFSFYFFVCLQWQKPSRTHLTNHIADMRSQLPYRKTTDGFLIYQGALLAQDRGHYLQLVGGGLAPGEDPITAQIREAKEETGAILTNVQLITDMQWTWPPTWADTLKRKARYAKFQGEHIYLLTGQVDRFIPPIGNKQDQWQAITTLSWEKAIKLAEKYYQLADDNSKVYKCYQMVIIKTLAALYTKQNS